jgi:uncharacterized membrane protein YfcA
VPDSILTLALLALAGGLAGWIDAIAGGGGLVQVPALMAGFPGVPVQALLGANKLSSVCGTGTALWRYRGLGLVRLRQWLPAVVAGLAGAVAGAGLAMLVPGTALKPLVLILVVMVLTWLLMAAAFTRPAGRADGKVEQGQWLLGVGVGVYDGFFGPGTGSFLVLALVRWFGLEPVTASAAAKCINLATNAGALAFFAASGSVLWAAAVPMAVCNVIGGWVGAGMAVRFGPRLVRGALVVVVLALVGKVFLDLVA